MNGILILNKPEGITSSKILNRIKKLLNIKKAGHTGTLDPFATGVLPICLNEATKVVSYLREDVKEYTGTIKLGISTDTLDKTGKIIQKNKVGKIKESDILDCFCKYKGNIKQIPPMYSAVKKDGVRLYSLARKGMVVDRNFKDVRIEKLELLDFELPYINFYVKCSKGTYIRSLSNDIGNELGCGGHLKLLKRISSGQFSIDDSYTFEDIESSNYKIIELNNLLNHVNSIDVNDMLAEIIRDGKKLIKEYFVNVSFQNFKKYETIAVKNNNNLIALTETKISFSEFEEADDSDVILRILRVININ
ncbi:MAG: tRNA pseudouridine(55) synthase TruB [Thermodesulfobacteriota bacterium]